MILGINCGRSFIVPEFGAGSSPRRIMSSRPLATRSPNSVHTLCTAKPSTRTVTSMNMVTPLRIVAAVLFGLLFGADQGFECLLSRAPPEDVCRSTESGIRCAWERCGVGRYLARGVEWRRRAEVVKERDRWVLVAVHPKARRTANLVAMNQGPGRPRPISSQPASSV